MQSYVTFDMLIVRAETKIINCIVYENRKFSRNKLLPFKEKITDFQLQFLYGRVYTGLIFCSHS